MPGLDVLWEPLRVGAVTLANRVFVSAHTPGFMDRDPVLGDRFVAYYEERARGGAGLLITGAQDVHPSGAEWPSVQLYRPEARAGHVKLAEAVHRHGSRVLSQLMHHGPQGRGTTHPENYHALLGPSDLNSPVFGRQTKVMEEEDIAMVVAAFADAAEVVQDSGVDGVELNAAHGYVVSAFLSPLYNRRTDAYGGSVENRCRLALEIGRAIRERCGDELVVSCRISFDEYIGAGGIVPDDSAQVLRVLHAARLFDMFNISSGSYHSMQMISPTMNNTREPQNAGFGGRAREIVGGEVPIAVAGNMRRVAQAAEVVARGDADLVAMTRAHLADPEIVAKARGGRVQEIRHCVAANQGCNGALVRGGPLSCTVNPATGRESYLGVRKLTPADTSRRVVIVGGGPAGMKAAETAATRGHEVTLLERRDELGGLLRYAGRTPDRDGWLVLADDLERSVRRLGVDVRTGTEASPELLGELAPEATVLATGAGFDTSGLSVVRPDRDAIARTPGARVIDPLAAIDDPDACGADVVVLDEWGDHIALGVARLLAEHGARVTIVSHQPVTAIYTMTQSFDFPIIHSALAAAGIQGIASATIDEITDDAVAVRELFGGAVRHVAADTVVVSGIRHAETGLYGALNGGAGSLHRIGDCLAPRVIDDAVFEGLQLGIGL